jgi:putative aldouronate transport system substrate-binding protein
LTGTFFNLNLTIKAAAFNCKKIKGGKVMVKKLMVLSLAVLIAMSVLNACGTQEVSKTNGPVEITVGGGMLGKLNRDDFGKWLGKRNNVKFKVINMEGNDALRLMAATNDLPDMVGGNMQFTEFYNFADQGLIRDIPQDMINKYPLVKSDVETNKITQMYKDIKGKVYGIPLTPSKLNKGAQAMDFDIFYRADWAKKLGITKQPETVDDMFNLYKAFTTRDPDGNGLNDTYGISGWLHDTHFMPWTDTYGWVNEGGKWIPGYISNAMLDGIKYWNMCFNEGVLDPEFDLANSNPRDLFMSGKVGVMFHNADIYWTGVVYDTFVQKTGVTYPQAYNAVKIIAPGPKKDANSPAYWPSKDPVACEIIGANVNDTKLDKILSLLNFMKGDEATQARRWGFEGTDYKMVNGKPQSSLPIQNNGLPAPIWTKYESINFMNMASLDEDWNLDPENKTYTDGIKKIYSDAEKKYNPTAYPGPLAINYASTDEKAKFNYNLVQMENDVSRIISSKPQDLDKAWANFKQTLYNTYGMQALIDSVNKVAKDRGITK